MGSEGACYSFYRPDVRMVAVLDLDVDGAVLFVESFYVAFDIGENLVEPVFVSRDLPSQKIL